MSFDVFDHDDYRELIRNWIAARPARSQSMLARRVGTSRSKVGMVLAGARDIGMSEVQPWANGMELDADSTEYFTLLVRADSPTSLELRREARIRAQTLRELRFSLRPNRELARMMSQWFVGCIMELARVEHFEPDTTALAARLWPEVSEGEVAEGLQQLEKSGFLQQIRQDPMRPYYSGAEISQELSRFAVPYHHTTIEHASLALDEQSPEDRSFFSGCIGVKQEDLPALRDALMKLSIELADRFEAPRQAERLVQVSVYLFSRTRTDS